MVQSLNTRAILSIATLVRRPGLLAPHVTVANVSQVDFFALKEHGFAAVIFDKDNTLTAPYVNDIIHPAASQGLNNALQAFGHANVAILSNSAGTRDDVDYKDATAIENKLGIAVIRHDEKKPGGLDEVLSHFNLTDATSICMVGDRILTDVVFGNLHNMLTIHCLPLCKGSANAKDNWTAKILRPIENSIVLSNWFGARYLAKKRKTHRLLLGTGSSAIAYKKSR